MIDAINSSFTSVYVGRRIRKLISGVVLLLLLSSSVSFAQEFIIDFSTARKYVDSLNIIRATIATPLPTITSGGTSLMRINNSQGDNLLTINISGLDPEEGRFDHLQFIIERNNLYVVGFINRNTNTFYRFSDFPHVNIPNVRTISLSGDSSYTTLQRIADISRTGMQINRHSLVTSYLDLISFSGTSLTQPVARAMLRFITVTAEALRFRQIQRGFRITLDESGIRPYIMSAEDVDLTLNWGRLSAILPDYQGQRSVRIGRISLEGINAILGAVALILHCTPHQMARMSRALHNDFPSMCPADSPLHGITQNNILWDVPTLSAILVRKTITH